MNNATEEVCSSNDPARNPHPDGLQPSRVLPGGVFCHIGRGAALNDINGTERDEYTTYMVGPEH